jgi:hypothetical protein
MNRNPLVTSLMAFGGIILLLPGLCSLVFFMGFVISDSPATFTFDDQLTRGLWIFWGISFLVAIGGALLLRVGLRR